MGLILAASFLFYRESRASLQQTSNLLLRQQAALFAETLTTLSSSELRTKVAILKQRYKSLIAIGTLDSYGQLDALHPERPLYRTAAEALLKNPNKIQAFEDAEMGTSVKMAGYVATMVGDTSTRDQRVVVLIDATLLFEMHDQAIRSFAGLFTIAALLLGWPMARWFDRQITRSLQAVAQSTILRRGETIGPIDLGQWKETAEIAEHFEELSRHLQESDSKAKRIERESKVALEKKQIGFARQLRRARDQAAIDPLTKLRNRSFLDDRMEPLFQHHLAIEEDLSVIMFDLDYFKLYNDAHGHQVGDAMLRFVGSLLRGGLRPTDYAIRYGGDEFLLVLPETNAEQARMVAERLIRMFRQYASKLGSNNKLSLSAGVASLCHTSPASGHALLAHADAALYAAKRDGKNSVESVQPLKKTNSKHAEPV